MNTARSLGSEEHAKILIAAVRDSDPGVAGNAARQLAQMGGPTAQSTLSDLLVRSDTSGETKKLAASALKATGGEAAERYKDLIEKHSGGPELRFRR